MNWEEEYEPEDIEVRPGPADDPAVQKLEPQLLQLFEADPERVFFETQLAIRFEDTFFHWVTVRALKDLRDSGSELQQLGPETHLRFYFNRRNRYWKRKASEVKKLVLLYSDPAFTPVLGAQGELLIDAALPASGLCRSPMQFASGRVSSGIRQAIISTVFSLRTAFTTVSRLRTA